MKVNIDFNCNPYLSFRIKRKINWKWIDFNWNSYWKSHESIWIPFLFLLVIIWGDKLLNLDHELAVTIKLSSKPPIKMMTYGCTHTNMKLWAETLQKLHECAIFCAHFHARFKRVLTKNGRQTFRMPCGPLGLNIVKFFPNSFSRNGQALRRYSWTCWVMGWLKMLETNSDGYCWSPCHRHPFSCVWLYPRFWPFLISPVATYWNSRGGGLSIHVR